MNSSRINSYVHKMYTNSELINQNELQATSYCIKGVDYEGRPTWNDYSWLADIGEGAYAKVIFAQKNRDFSKYAIKQLNKSNMNKNARNNLDLYREIDVQKNLNHQNVVRIFEYIDDEDYDEKLHIVMEYCSNGEIMKFYEDSMTFVPSAALLKDQSQNIDEENHQNEMHIQDQNTYLSERTVQKITQQILDGMDYVHQKGYLHLDIKPQNILLDENNNVKIADFGSCWMFGGGDDQIQEVKGTPYFLAPETLYDPIRNKYSQKYFSGMKYDVWTIGITIYCLIFNRLPYKLESTGQSDIHNAIINFQLQLGDLINEEHGPTRQISEGLKIFLYKILEKDPNKRPTIQQLKKDVWLNTKL